MNAKKCDRCGSYYDKYGKPPYVVRKTSDFSETTEAVDLCKMCSLELSEWFLAKKLGESEVRNNEN